MRAIFLFFLIPFFSTFLVGQGCLDPSPNFKVFISEISQGRGSTNEEFIELAIVGEPGIVDLSGYIIDDNNAPGYGNGNQPGHIRLGECFSEVETGTIILLYNNFEIHPNITSSGTHTMIIPFSNSCIERFPYPTNSNPEYKDIYPRTWGSWTDYIPLHNEGDCVRLLDKNKQVIQSLAWGPSNNFIQPYTKISNSLNISKKAHGVFSLSDDYEVGDYLEYSYTEATPGRANSLDIQSLLDNSKINHGLSLELLEVNPDYGYYTGSALLKIIGGEAPFEIVESFDNFYISEENEIYLHEQHCGDINIVIHDANGCSYETTVSIPKGSKSEYIVCEGDCVYIDPYTECDDEDICFIWESDVVEDKEARPLKLCPTESEVLKLKIIDSDGSIVEERQIEVIVRSELADPQIISYPTEIVEGHFTELFVVPDIFNSFIWRKGNEIAGDIIGFNEKIKVTTPGLYSVEVNYNNGCRGYVEYEVSGSEEEDFDGDGVLNEDDCNPIDSDLYLGAPCDDDNQCTSNDRINEACECEGSIIPNCDGCNPGKPCDDGNPCTTEDIFDRDCNCIGQFIEDCFQCIEGSPCDDGNECTKNDKFLENCDCIGELIIQCEPCSIGTPCDDGDECTVNDVFDENCTCIGQPKEAPSILGYSNDKVCESQDEYILSSVENEFEHTWYFDNNLVGLGSSYAAKQEGTYTLISRDDAGCVFESQININDHDLSILSDNEFLCSGESTELIIENIFSSGAPASVLWSDGTNNYPKKIVTQPGNYSVTVTYSSGCIKEASIKITSEESNNLDEKLLEMGFEKYEVVIASTPGSTKPGFSQRNNPCDLEYDPQQSFTFEKTGIETLLYNDVNVDATTITDVELLCGVIDNSLDCSIDIDAIYATDVCSIEEEVFLDALPRSFRAILIPAEEGETTSLYIRSYLTDKCAIINAAQPRNNKDDFYSFLQEFLCGYHSESPEDKLVELPDLNLGIFVDFSSSNLTLFDGETYNSLYAQNGFLVKNYESGERLDLTNFEVREEDLGNSSSVCITYNLGRENPSYTYNVPNKELWIPYYNSCDRYLKISFHENDVSKVLNLINNAPQIANSSDLMDDNVHFYQKVESLPVCLLEVGTLCAAISDERMLVSEAREALLNLISRTNTYKHKQEFVTCTRDYSLLKPTHEIVFPAGFFQDATKDRVEYLEFLVNAYYSFTPPPSPFNYDSDKPSDIVYSELDGRGRIIGFGDRYKYFLLDDEIAYLSYYRYPFGQTEYTPQGIHNYFEGRPVYLSEHYNFLMDTATYNNLVDNGGRPLIEVPGFYILYAIHKNARKELNEDVVFVTNVAAFAISFGTLNAAIQAVRASAFSTRFGLLLLNAELVSVTAHVFLDESVFCENLDKFSNANGEVTNLCNAYKEALIYFDMALLGGVASGAVANKVLNAAQPAPAREAFEAFADSYHQLHPDNKTVLKSKMQGSGDAFEKIMLASKISKLDQLQLAFLKVREKYGVQIFKNIEDVEGIENIVSISSKIDELLGVDKTFEFLSDIAATKGFSGQLADGMKEFSFGKVKAYDILKEIGSDLLVDVPALTKLTKDIDVNPALEAYLRNNPSKKDAWELIYKSFYSHDEDVLNYVDEIKTAAKVGNASSTNYVETFFSAFPNQSLQGNGFVVHHAIEQQVLTKYPGLFTEAELHSLQNLRGISPEINGPLHLSNIRTEWNKFYNQFPAGISPTKQQVLDKATEIDNLFGNLFSPPIRSL